MATDQFFYVLLCNDQSFYGGYTTDLSRRLLEHNTGTGANIPTLRVADQSK